MCITLNNTIVQLFEQQVIKTPNNIAIIYRNQKLTYQQLNNQANNLARYLSDLGVTTNVLVGISINRSLEMIIGVLAILKAGGAYVPLDPTYPEERIKFMLADSGISILLTQKKLSNKFTDYQGKILEIDASALRKILQKRAAANLVTSTKPKNLAYVLYTSGSTGLPKGVTGHHLGVINRHIWMRKYYPIEKHEVFCQKASLNFIDSLLEICDALLSGSILILIAEDILQSPEKFLAILKKHLITRLLIVPSFLQSLLEYYSERFKALNKLKYLFVSGESVPSKLVSQVYALTPMLQVINLYGLTETLEVTHYSYPHTMCANTPVIIGQAIDNMQIYVLDETQSILPANTAGELYVAGIGLTDGYLNRPDLTEERFINNPFDKNTNSKLYKTGDLGKLLLDGNIEYLSRSDQQVELRGFRVELSEIEQILCSYKSVETTIVLLKENELEQKILVVYVTGTEIISTSELHKYLEKKLPKYMLPSIIMQLEAFPLTPNGKIDRKALPMSEIKSCKKYTAPRTDLERQLIIIWQEILHVNEIGIDDDFFRLGGHSLLVIKLKYLIEQRLKLEVPARLLFQYPTIASLSKKLASNNGKKIKWPRIIADVFNRYEPFALTDVQYAYWIGRQALFGIGNISTHVYFEFDYLKLDIQQLESSLNELIKRHEMLRAVFTSDGKQRILKFVPQYKIAAQQLTGKAIKERVSKLNDWRQELSQQVFDAMNWPVFEIRVSILKNKYRLHVSLDALIFDGVSFQIFFNEWSDLYNGENTLPKLSLSFRDYIIAYNKMQQSERYFSDKEYWMGRIHTLPFGPELPVLVQPGSIKNPIVVRRASCINSNLWGSFKNRAQQYGINPTSALLFIFGIVLSRWSKTKHFLINLTLFNRLPLHQQVDNIIGDFTTLELLEFGSGAKQNNIKDFVAGARKLQSLLWEDLEHRLFDGIEIQRELSKIHGKSPGVLAPIVFTSMLNLSETALVPKFLSDSYIDTAYSAAQTPQVWLDNNVYENDKGLVIEWDYVENLFPHNLVNDMHKAYCKLIEHLANSTWVEPLPDILSQADLHVIREINLQQQPLPTKCLHEVFIEQAKLNSKKIAVIAAGEKLTYQQIYEKSNQLANALLDLNVRSNDLVAILMEKGWMQIVACLAIMQSGAAYLPLNINWPQARIQKILKHAQVKLVLSQKKFLANIAKENYEYLVIDDKDFWQNCAKTSINVAQKLEDMAYVIFTSGSTGQPKGVMISHKGAMNTIIAINKYFHVNSKDKILAISDLSFDLSVYDIFGLLAVGGTIVIPEQNKIRDPQHWLDLIKTHKVTLWNTVPMLMQMLIECINTSQIKRCIVNTFRLVLLSGDWIPVTLPNQIKEIASLSKVISLGGATEGSIWSVFYPIEQINSCWESIPYGRALPNQKMYVFNENFTYCPLHVPGEIYIGGIGVALGYWKDELNTRSRFVRHPKTGEKLYKTGDIGKLLPSGNIEFMGRIDNQVKLSGFRIELGEIETILGQYENINQAVVMIMESKGQKKLVAYYTLKNKKDRLFSIERLRNFLAHQLPDYMLPSFFIELAAIPLTLTGKIDHHALPALKDASFNTDNKYIAPSSFSEQVLVNIWHDVLDVKLISVQDDFFQLGGNSLLAVKLLAKINKVFVSNLTVAWVFQYNTIKRQAEEIKQAEAYSSYKPIVQFKKTLSEKQIPFIFIHPGNAGAEVYQELAENLSDQISFYALESYNLYSNKHFICSIKKLAALYIKYIKKIQVNGPYYLGGWSLGGLIACEIAQQLFSQKENVMKIYLLDTFNPECIKFEHQIEDVDTVSEYNELYKAKLKKLIMVEAAMMNNYKLRTYSGRTILFKATQQNKENLKSIMKYDNGLGDIFTDFKIYNIDCNHKNITKADNAYIIAEIISDDIVNSYSC